MAGFGGLWHPGRRRRSAQGVGVFGSPGFADDQQGLADLLGRHDRLADWMSAAGLDLQVSAAGLESVDTMIDTWRDDLTVVPQLANEVGVFLGDVLLHEIPGARWLVWPNGHPVIHLPDGREIDVTERAGRRIRRGRPRLTAVLGTAGTATKRRP